MPKLADDKLLYSGLIRLHILHHAAKEPIYGLWMVEELQRHGYKLSTGTLYPILHGMERKGYLRSHVTRDGKTSRRIYQSTGLGRRALKSALGKVRELFRELVEEYSDHKKITRPKDAL